MVSRDWAGIGRDLRSAEAERVSRRQQLQRETGNWNEEEVADDAEHLSENEMTEAVDASLAASTSSKARHRELL